MIGWVYIATNQSLPGLVKVGFSSRDPSERMKELSQAGLPHDHECAFWIMCNDAYRVEQLAHRALGDFHHGKEWFSCDIPRAASALLDIVPSPVQIYDAQKVKYDALRLKREQEAAAKAKAEADRRAWEAQEATDAPIRAAARLAEEKRVIKRNAVLIGVGSVAAVAAAPLLAVYVVPMAAFFGGAALWDKASAALKKPKLPEAVAAKREAQMFREQLRAAEFESAAAHPFKPTNAMDALIAGTCTLLGVGVVLCVIVAAASR